MASEVDLSEFMEQKPNKCTFCLAMSKLSPEKVRLVNAAVESPEIQSIMIKRRLSEGSSVAVAKDAVMRHRSGDCPHA